MNISLLTRLGGVLAALASVAVLAAPTALADPPNYQRQVPQGQVGLTHFPEIVSGLASSAAGRPAPRPEIISGIVVPGENVLARGYPQPSAFAAQRGFDWTDAIIGAGVALAAAALAYGSALALRKRLSLAH